MLSPSTSRLIVLAMLLGAVLGVGRSADQSATGSREVAVARKSEIQALKQNLEAAGTPEAKRAVVEEYRAKVEEKMAARKAAQPQVPEKTPQEVVAELKSRTGDDPAMQKRVADLEQRLTSIETLKQKLAEIEAAEADEKRELVEEFRTEQRSLAQQREQEVAAQQAQAGSSPQELPPAMQAMRAKAEARKQEVEDLKAALEQAQPQERVELIDVFREKQKAAAAEREQEGEAQIQSRPAQP